MIVRSFSAAWFKIQSVTLANLSLLEGKHVMCTYDILRTQKLLLLSTTPPLYSCSQHSFFPKSCCSGQVPLKFVHFKPNRPPGASVTSLGCIITSVTGHQSAVSLVSQHHRPFLSHCWTKLSPRRVCWSWMSADIPRLRSHQRPVGFWRGGSSFGDGTVPLEVLVSNQAR